MGKCLLTRSGKYSARRTTTRTTQYARSYDDQPLARPGSQSTHDANQLQSTDAAGKLMRATTQLGHLKLMTTTTTTMITKAKTEHNQPTLPTATISISGHEVLALIDTVASTSFLSAKWTELHSIPVREGAATFQVRTALGQEEVVRTQAYVDVCIAGVTVPQTFLVSSIS